MMQTLNDALAGLKLDARCIDAKQNGHFSFYDVQLGPGCRVSKLQSFSSEIALKLRARTTPIIRPIPSEGIVRLQVVNGDPEIVMFDDLYNSTKPCDGLLPFMLGKTDQGEILWTDMAQNPHMLVAGSTGSGKSVFLHALVANAARLPDVRLWLVDPKGVEFMHYGDSRLSDLVVTMVQDYHSTIRMLDELVDEMESRYASLRARGLSGVEQAPDLFSKIIVIIDEVSDLMLIDGKTKRFQNLVIKLAQKCRAAGIYLVLATQRPSVGFVSGDIKANFGARLACKVSSMVDSRVTLDHPGAEHLMGRGDAILKNYANQSTRLQVAYTTPQATIQHYIANQL